MDQDEIDLLIDKMIGAYHHFVNPRIITVKVCGERTSFNPDWLQTAPMKSNGNNIMVMNAEPYDRQIKVPDISSIWKEQGQTMIQVNNEVLIIEQKLNYIMDEIGWNDR